KDGHDRQSLMLTFLLFELATATFERNAGRQYNEYYAKSYRLDPFTSYDRDQGMSGEQVMRHFETRGLRQLPNNFDPTAFARLLSRENTRVYSPSAWQRSEGE